MGTMLFSSQDNSLYERSYKDYLEDNNLTTEDISFDEYVESERQIDFDFLMEELSIYNDCVIDGTLGLWTGRKAIVPIRCETVCEAVKKCIGEGDGFDVAINDGVLHVNRYHHDGTNSFDIYLLNKAGVNASAKADLTKKCYHKKLNF